MLSLELVFTVFYFPLLLFYDGGGLKIGSLNMNGGRDRHKRALIAEVVEQNKIDVLFLQETHSDEINAVDWGMSWKGSFFLSHGTNVSGGVAVLFSDKLNVNIISKVELVKGRVAVVRAEIKGSVLCLVNVYAPNQGSERITLFNKLKDELGKNQDLKIIVGDWKRSFSVEQHPASSCIMRNVVLRS